MISTTLLDQLQLKWIELDKPLQLQLAVSGSRSTIKFGTRARFQYQGIDEEHYFNVANVSGYDMILGTPWLYQHCVFVGFNEAKVIVGSVKCLPIKTDPWVLKVVLSHVRLGNEELERCRSEIMEFARPLLKKASETPLPPL